MLACALPASASAQAVPTIKLDRDGPVTVLVQSKSALNVLGMAVASPSPVDLCADCRGGETVQLGAMSAGTEIVLRLTDGEKTFLSVDPTHARIEQTGGTWRIGWDDSLGDGDFQDLVVTIAVPTLPPPVDRDADGVSPPTDCNDTNSAVRPGAPEVPGNELDDDCLNGDAPASIAAVVTVLWNGHRGGGVRLSKLEVRDAPPAAQILVRCRGKRCAFKTKRATAKADGTAKLLTLVKGRRLRPNITLDVVISAPNMIGKVRRYEVQRRKMSNGRTYCTPPGLTNAIRC
ncbi:putative metal-binding motif-containing protein [Solirubrobacter deserti]|uniref:Metal-binding motif-containing protein n=1 Tax=Solirubrobacter deserti TaxID=2282478 RepID=A0ABT4RMP1_9ACTN|nr:putative metal-binding motif-containing protein [Solirubrobacter deserti]MDA0139555.1 putative metal-binding motif-containing protein [Solirubrobacter deserti]